MKITVSRPKEEEPRKSKVKGYKEDDLSSLIPTEKSVPISRVEDAVLLIYGQWKIGKTATLAQFNNPLFLMFEKGGSGLSIYQRKMKTWETARRTINELVKTKKKHKFRTIIFDTADLMYSKASKQICMEENWDHISTPGYGKGYDRVDEDIFDYIYKLLDNDFAVAFTSHAKEVEFTNKYGIPYKRIVPTMTGRCREFVGGLADVILFFGYFGEERYCQLIGNDEVDAGTRLDNQFWVKNYYESRRVEYIPMGKSAAEGYKNLVRAFNNEQPNRGRPEFDIARLVDVKKKIEFKRKDK